MLNNGLICSHIIRTETLGLNFTEPNRYYNRFISNNLSEIKDLPIGYFDASTGSATAIEAAAKTHLLKNNGYLI